MKEIDWSQAPEGVTHYSCNDWHTPWRKVEAPDRAFWWDGQRWEPVHGFRMPLPAEYVPIHADGPVPIPAPDDLPAPTWNGEGLPPVGAKVILSDANYNVFEPYKEMIGVEVAVVASFTSPSGFDMIACALPDGLCGCFRADMARPIRTPEQIAAEEREKAVDEMMAVHEPWIATRRFCEKLYDAGYRRQEPKE